MKDKKFVLVSQGIEIMRTESQEKAINVVKRENDEWFDYKQRCIDNYEPYADNYIDLEIEYTSEKNNKDKVINDLLKRISDLEFEVERQEQRIDKAIECIESRNYKCIFFNEKIDRDMFQLSLQNGFKEDLLEILKGVDKE